VPPFLSSDTVVRHMATFGRIVRSSRGAHRLLPRAADGVIHLSMHLNNADRLPAFLRMVDEGGHLAALRTVHTDSRHCYKCGGNHVAMWCRASGRPAGTPPSLWSTFSVTAADASTVPPRSAPAAATPHTPAAAAAHPTLAALSPLAAPPPLAAAVIPVVPQPLGDVAHPPLAASQPPPAALEVPSLLVASAAPPPLAAAATPVVSQPLGDAAHPLWQLRSRLRQPWRTRRCWPPRLPRRT
jgi:hypothetical protein